GYTPANVYASITGPDPNFTRALLIGDCGTITASVQCSQSGPNSITQLGYGALTIGGNDQLVDQGGTEFRDTTIESPTGIVRFRGKPGGETTSNPAQIQLDGNSSSSKEDFINFANANILYWRISTDIGGDGADDFCFALNLTNPSSGQCQAYIGPNWHFQFSGINNAPSGSISPAGDFTFKQMANGDSAIMILRNTDTSPTGYLLDIDDATDSHPLFRVDALGNTTVNATLTANVIQNNCSGVSAQMSAGTVTILNTCLTAGRPILLNEASKSGVQGILSYVLTSGQIIISSSSSLDTSTVAWSQQ
ncbi:MAG: hypothetical protein ACRD22_16530, partial [Terriglobia bacterium]